MESILVKIDFFGKIFFFSVRMEISYPHHRLWIRPATEIFTNLRQFIPRPQYFRYYLRAYFPKYKLYLAPKFRGQSVYLMGSMFDYWNIDVLSDWYLEDERLKAHRDGVISPIEFWNSEAGQQIAKDFPNPQECRQELFKKTYEARQFRPTWVRGLIHLVYPGLPVKGKTMLDISAGWGDRLLSAMAMGMKYIGYDPNINLKDGHDEMIKDFGNPKDHQVIYRPFEDVVIPDGSVDVVLSSPPFFTLEQYSKSETQSVVRYPKLGDWLRGFLIPSLTMAWSALRDDGYLILHLGDTWENPICELIQRYIESCLPGSSWEGIVGVSGGGPSPKFGPVWIWRRFPVGEPRVRWNPEIAAHVRTKDAVLQELANHL